MVARAMDNFGLKKLLLVNPREKWPNEISFKSSKKSKELIQNTLVYNSLPEALKNFNLVIATTNRKRFLEKKIIKSFNNFFDILSSNKKTAILFGPENSGLKNEDLRLVDYIYSIETSNTNNSLNLSHAVSIISYKIFEYTLNKKINLEKNNDNYKIISNKKDLEFFMNYLIFELEKKNFFIPLNKKRSMINNIYSIFLKASLTKKEINTLFGILKKLSK